MRSQYRRPRTSLTASAIPSVPPASWYENPNLTAPTAITVTDDGKIFGHLAPWGTCHTGFRDSCVTAPKSTTDYAYFTIGSTAVECNDCDDKKVSEIRTGVITLGTLHAGQKLNGRAALSHYENTGAAVADVAAGEDTHGIWIAGALRPTVTEKEMRELRGAALSGDWRRINGNLELVAALAVNTPGFPVIRASAFVAEDGEQMSLVAAGALVAKPKEKLDEPTSIFDKLKQSLAYGYDKPKKRKKEMASEDLVNKIALAFSPDQERDENGRWASGGGGSSTVESKQIEAIKEEYIRNVQDNGLEFVKAVVNTEHDWEIVYELKDVGNELFGDEKPHNVGVDDVIEVKDILAREAIKEEYIRNVQDNGTEQAVIDTNQDWEIVYELKDVGNELFGDEKPHNVGIDEVNEVKKALASKINAKEMSLIGKITLAFNPNKKQESSS